MSTSDIDDDMGLQEEVLSDDEEIFSGEDISDGEGEIDDEQGNDEEFDDDYMSQFKISKTRYDPIETEKISQFVESYNSLGLNMSPGETENTFMFRKLLTNLIEPNIDYYQQIVRGAMRTNTRLYNVEY